MEKMAETPAKIVNLEWKMFQNTKNIDGRAVCQDDYQTFTINRFSQVQSWSIQALDSYLADLETADQTDRNLVSEKYARMMASTSPIEYAAIAHLLPPVDERVVALSEAITSIVIEWELELIKKYPHITKLGRPIHTSQDTPTVTSMETYLRGELLTYSIRTLEILHKDYLEYKSVNINGSEIILEQMMKHYGFSSLSEAEKAVRSRAND